MMLGGSFDQVGKLMTAFTIRAWRRRVIFLHLLVCLVLIDREHPRRSPSIEDCADLESKFTDAFQMPKERCNSVFFLEIAVDISNHDPVPVFVWMEDPNIKRLKNMREVSWKGHGMNVVFGGKDYERRMQMTLVTVHEKELWRSRWPSVCSHNEVLQPLESHIVIHISVVVPSYHSVSVFAFHIHVTVPVAHILLAWDNDKWRNDSAICADCFYNSDRLLVLDTWRIELLMHNQPLYLMICVLSYLRRTRRHNNLLSTRYANLKASLVEVVDILPLQVIHMNKSFLSVKPLSNVGFVLCCYPALLDDLCLD